MASLSWLTEGYDPPAEPFRKVKSSRPQPESKRCPPVKIQPNMVGARTDEELRQVLDSPSNSKVVVSFGSSWCTHCHEMLPHYIKFSREFPKNKYVVAQVDYMFHEAKGIKYTPTYTFFSKGKKVDEFFGSDAQRLRDHLWLHSPLTE
uniref:Thioredoxin domain-containing protein n=1 Tax=Tetraselmis chuii TaxID=63592 RepID=A0A7S1SWN0_9CHLO|mmetsp:Transcript_33091/g.59274  ORF Transcript_33091/g.59274 Transcript_33091/m.59274 type:complete len:148 (+) Transcript_33091:115-558(+)|eukprot:CAMPEP_0177758864 /NCGR_PEP_ID=MMETSP0491_2-20121128/4418_1 /TAXON_ID=63592 /ORGANISM="Tetraselmis chuii, Strain PLY429" /LENGTH=147 /DNA_ID=CAMNT_0019274639 /DNA_START=115 /DNA_END=558 /DNA_ORIENTATION=+